MTQGNDNNPYSFFHDIVCINIDERKERKQQASELFNQLNIKARFHIVKRHPKGGVYGCFESHIDCIKDAYRKGIESLLVFEDDIKNSPSYTTKQVQTCVEFLKQRKGKWDIFYLGYFPFDDTKGSLKGLFKARFETDNIISFSPLATHAYCVSREGMRKILKNYKGNIGNIHYDVYLSQLNLKSYCVVPILFDQKLCLQTDNQALNKIEAFARRFQCFAERMHLMYKPSLIKYNINKYNNQSTFNMVVLLCALTTLIVVSLILYTHHQCSSSK